MYYEGTYNTLCQSVTTEYRIRSSFAHTPPAIESDGSRAPVRFRSLPLFMLIYNTANIKYAPGGFLAMKPIKIIFHLEKLNRKEFKCAWMHIIKTKNENGEPFGIMRCQMSSVSVVVSGNSSTLFFNC